LEDALKKLVYINKFPNLAVDFSYKKELNSYDFYSLAGKIFDIDFNVEPNKDILEKTPLIKVDLIFVEDIYNTKKTLAEPPKAASIL
jgi:hypothetical protein